MTTNDDVRPHEQGDEIRKIREGQGLSQRRLAKLADVDRASLLRFEKGDARGNLDMVGKSPRCIPWSSAAKLCNRLHRFSDPALRGGAGLSLWAAVRATAATAILRAQ